MAQTPAQEETYNFDYVRMEDRIFMMGAPGIVPEITNGRVSLPLFPQGHPNETIVSHMMQSQSLERGEAIFMMRGVEAYLEEQNARTDQIRASTEVTSHPQLVMTSPQHRGNLGETVGWALLVARLEASGAEVTVNAHSDTRLSSEVWTRDAFVIHPDGTVLFPNQHRKVEPATQATSAPGILQAPPNTELGRSEYQNIALNLMSHFSEQQVPMELVDAYYEGGNVLQHRQSNTVFVGIRTDKTPEVVAALREDAQTLASRLGMALVTVDMPMHQRAYYHLDTLMTVLPDGSVLLRPEGTTPEGIAAIRGVIAEQDLLLLPRAANMQEADQLDIKTQELATNLVTVNGNVFTPYAPEAMRVFLEARGFHVWEGPHRISNSGPHCQVNFERREQAPDGRTDVALVNPNDFPNFNPQLVEPPDQFRPEATGKSSSAQIARV